MASFTTYIRALRLPFLIGSLLPVAAATALAYWLHQAFNLGFCVLNLLGVAGLHLGANLINDYYDAFGSDPLNVNATPFSGGSRVIQNQELEADTVKTLAYFFLAVGVVCGLALIYASRHWVAVFGFLGLLAGIFYSASPVQLMSLGLGEILIFLAFGPLLTLGSYYVQTGKLAPVGAAVGLPLAFLITAIIWINEFPDLEADLAAAKRHLVSRLGLRLSRWVYAALMLAPFASLFVLLEYFLLPDLIVAALVALPLALRAIRLVWRVGPTEPDFVSAQALTIQTHFWLGLTFTLALFYAAWLR
ncbi:MAG: prenyltransferase [Deltaproteobacteria bacterium]|nr:prenyltransferase [Deltaproteobacteria bacterium]